MSALGSRRLFFYLLWFTLLLKLAWAAWMPLTGDEAYFFTWAKNPDFGYYDHPPMVGWWLTLLHFFGDANWWLRLPAVLLNTGIAAAIYLILRGVTDETRALLGASLYLLSPLSLINVFITTDTPLIFFSFLSAWSFSRALKKSTWQWYLISGLLLGAAFMAKYFAVLLGFSFGLYILIYRRNRRDMLGLLWLFLAVLPFAGLNIWWNYCNCWNNILFNVYNRHGGNGFFLDDYLLMLAYLVTPPLLWYGWRERYSLWAALRSGRPYVFLWFAPVLLFLLLSLKTRIGLHWILAFYPFVFIALVPLLSLQALQRTLKFMAVFSLLHIIAIAIIFMLPVETWKDRSAAYNGILLGLHTDEFVKQFDRFPDGFVRATGSYVDSSILGKESGKRFIVFGDGSKYGRQDDLLTDWRKLEGKNIAVLRDKKKTVEEYRMFFQTSNVHEFVVKGRAYYLLEGRRFRYEVYREKILSDILNKYYRMPDFLPANNCYFYQRYFPGESVMRLQP